MSTVPVKVDAPALALSVTENPGYLTIESGQNTHWFEEARTSVIHLAMVYPASHTITVTPGNGFSQLSDVSVNLGISNGSFRVKVLQANAEDVTFPIELPIVVPSGGWVEGFAVLIQNAEPAPSALLSELSSHDLNVTRERDMNTYVGSGDPFRRVSYLFLAKSSTSAPTTWLNQLTSGLPGVSSTGTIQVPGTNVYLNLFVVPTPEMYVPTDDYQMTFHFSGGSYLKGFLIMTNLKDEFPPLCNDPAHVPVTITITAHGPVDVQVD